MRRAGAVLNGALIIVSLYPVPLFLFNFFPVFKNIQLVLIAQALVAMLRLSLVAVRRLLSNCAVSASLFAEHGLWSTGSVVVAHGLICFKARGIVAHQGFNLCPLH